MGTEGAATTASDTSTTTTSTGDTSTQQTTTTAAESDWTGGLSDDLKGYVQTKGFKAPQDVLESYRNYEKLQGVPQDRLLKIPENLDTPEGRAIMERLGLPKDAKEYNIEVPKEYGDQAMADWLRETAHKNGFTKKQVEGFVKDLNAKNGQAYKTAVETQQVGLRAADDNLKKEWGNAYDANKNMADQGAIALGMGADEVKALGKALGPDKAMMLLHKLASATSEHEFVGGKPAPGNMTPEMALNKISSLKADKSFGARLSSGDADAVKEWQRAHEMAYPGMSSL